MVRRVRVRTACRRTGSACAGLARPYRPGPRRDGSPTRRANAPDPRPAGSRQTGLLNLSGIRPAEPQRPAGSPICVAGRPPDRKAARPAEPAGRSARRPVSVVRSAEPGPSVGLSSGASAGLPISVGRSAGRGPSVGPPTRVRRTAAGPGKPPRSAGLPTRGVRPVRRAGRLAGLLTCVGRPAGGTGKTAGLPGCRPPSAGCPSRPADESAARRTRTASRYLSGRTTPSIGIEPAPAIVTVRPGRGAWIIAPSPTYIATWLASEL